MFEAVNGYGFRGDMAIDDVSLNSCSGVSPTGTPSSRKCTFEQSNICGYTQDKTDVFDWTRKSRGTGTSGTGPSQDHTYGTSRGEF